MIILLGELISNKGGDKHEDRQKSESAKEQRIFIGYIFNGEFVGKGIKYLARQEQINKQKG